MSTTNKLSVFAINMTRRRTDLGLSQRDLVRLAKTTTIAALETGKTGVPREDAMDAIAEALDCTVSDLWRKDTDAVREQASA